MPIQSELAEAIHREVFSPPFGRGTDADARAEKIHAILVEALTIDGHKPDNATVAAFVHATDDKHNKKYHFSIFPFAQALKQHIQENIPAERAAELVDELYEAIKIIPAKTQSFAERNPPHTERNAGSSVELG